MEATCSEGHLFAFPDAFRNQSGKFPSPFKAALRRPGEVRAAAVEGQLSLAPLQQRRALRPLFLEWKPAASPLQAKVASNGLLLSAGQAICLSKMRD